MKVLLALLILALPLHAANQPPASAQKTFEGLMNAIETGNFDAFIAPGNAAFQKELPPQAFQSVSAQLAPVLKPGFESDYLTSLTQQGLKVYLWKIVPKGSPNQFVAKLVLDGDLVAGFWIN